MRSSLIICVLFLVPICSDLAPARAQSHSLESTSQRKTRSIHSYAGEYRWATGFSSENLKLFRNGRFGLFRSSDVVGSGVTDEGHYIFEKGILVLSPKYSVLQKAPKSHKIPRVMVWHGNKLKFRPVK